jgi:hypothetical protein
VVMLVVHWFWSRFMLSPYARNFFFGADLWDYGSRLGPWRYQYWNRDLGSDGQPSAMALGIGLSIAAGIAIVTSRLGLAWGKGMARIKR